MKLIKKKSKSLNDIQFDDDDKKNDVLYLGNRAEPGVSGSSVISKSTVGKLSIRRRRKNHSHSSVLE